MFIYLYLSIKCSVDLLYLSIKCSVDLLYLSIKCSVDLLCIYIRIAQLCKDYCGVLNEESLRLNFILVYELLDEVLVSELNY